MRRNISIIFTALLFSGLPACFYTDSELYTVEPIPGDRPHLSVSINLDTLQNPQVNDSLEVIYQVEITDGKFYYVYADVGTSPVFESDSTYGTFWIQSELADASGVDTLFMEFFYSTNSNSFADRVGYEALVDTLKYAIDFNLEDAK